MSAKLPGRCVPIVTETAAEPERSETPEAPSQLRAALAPFLPGSAVPVPPLLCGGEVASSDPEQDAVPNSKARNAMRTAA